MANMCNHTVQFEGGAATMEKLKQLFETMAAKYEQENQGQLPDFIQEKSGCFFDLIWEDTGVLQYQTRWSPNLDILQAIAEHFGAGFTCNYEETGNCIYGEASFENGIISDTALEWEDFDLFSYDDKTDSYSFEGEKYESDCDILEILLKRRIQGVPFVPNQKTTNTI